MSFFPLGVSATKPAQWQLHEPPTRDGLVSQGRVGLFACRQYYIIALARMIGVCERP
jgi:hypothetical protein